MFAFKDHMLKISLIFILFTTVLLSFYSIWNYHSSLLHHDFREGEHHFFHDRNQAPTGKGSFSEHIFREKPVPPLQNGQMFRGIANSDVQYAPFLSVYSVLFFGLFAFTYYLLIEKNMNIQDSNKKILLWTLLAIGLFLRIAAAPWIKGHTDVNLFKHWAISATKGFSQFYRNSSSDYPPFYIYILFVIGKITSIPAMSCYITLLIKLPSMLADIITAYIIYRLAVTYLSGEMSLWLSAFYIFNPAVFMNSTVWGQVDSFFTLLIVLAVFLLTEKKVNASTALFTAAVLMKPQGIIFLPVLFFELIRLKSIKRFFTAAVTSFVTALIIIFPFSLKQDPLWIFTLFSSTIGEYPYASVNAFNFYSLLGANYVPNTSTLFLFSYHTWGMIFIVIITAFSWFIYIKGRNTKFAALAALLQIAGVFTLATGMHERYLFPAAALSILAFIYWKDKRLLWLSAGFSATTFINTYSVFYDRFMFHRSMGAPYNFTLIFTSLLNVIFFIYLVKVAWDIAIRSKTLTFKPS
ncbi:glycosyltransferase 87 family protein [Thermaerobacillus caldiproteolyticus]|uniref:Gpi18-like mannosyltransferase n=1 Tax=Thermaerobacillus caldiproteolyticus TaxID=247480 RepID=A0A7W0BYM9_9BACL|nr:glycosyltransferase 87 family protein [Anoxybacillus caldiproteolyticus]MBA2875153.1 Gpi18-like mannosyltransferase [Anoxybacillus caldiproteolyticus]